MKWIVGGLFFLGLLFMASAWHESRVGGDNPTGNQWERRQAAPFGWLAGIVMIVVAIVLATVYADLKALFS